MAQRARSHFKSCARETRLPARQRRERHLIINRPWRQSLLASIDDAVTLLTDVKMTWQISINRRLDRPLDAKMTWRLFLQREQLPQSYFGLGRPLRRGRHFVNGHNLAPLDSCVSSSMASLKKSEDDWRWHPFLRNEKRLSE